LSAEPAAWVELERLERRKAREHSLVLQAVDIPHGLVEDRGSFAIVVRAAELERARAELERYEHENAGWPPRDERFQPLSGGPAAAALYCAAIAALFLAQRSHAWGVDWTRAGRASAAEIRAGEWWRAVTALTLHADLPHVAGNAVFGAFFGVLLSQAVGAGAAWASILCAGALGNLLNAWIQRPEHGSIGASTAVFGAVGCLAAYRWRTRGLGAGRRRTWLPLVMGIALLGYMGFPSELPEPGYESSRPLVDVVAHATGFAAGAALGVVHASPAVRRRSGQALQTGLAWLTAAALVAAWALALN
jgi:membrane associated rhomboid family serine protease